MSIIINSIDNRHLYGLDSRIHLFKIKKMIETKSVNTLHELLDDNIRRFIVAESELQNVLPYFIQTASNVALKNVLQK